ncbi:Spx/MgsR family RNA polymerase-binding regulatory protein [Solimonas terrae]|uniref:Spx/MgsR family RNA polymerase-binding regulatory protein n=1 Tax=Solimonas terrae TaxID=1396819 RepID=A0A6M2BVX0_9GAMM|nr:Spx/MgsR family RNA polymerase-binding regulatory protein [Solimonas terrae]
MITLYGIKNCDTVQRARKRLDAEGIAYRFHDFKRDRLSHELAQRWIDALGVDAVVNRKGTTWHKLDDAKRAGLTTTDAAALLAREPSLVRRPVIDRDGALSVGFAKVDEDAIVARLR